MQKQFTNYQLEGLLKLTAYKQRFKGNERVTAVTKTKKPAPALINAYEEFMEVFCGHDLADTDYAFIKTNAAEHEPMEDWINQLSMESILKNITYIIWTDRIVQGYFALRIEDNTVFFLLDRLEKILRTKWEILSPF